MSITPDSRSMRTAPGETDLKSSVQRSGAVLRVLMRTRSWKQALESSSRLTGSVVSAPLRSMTRQRPMKRSSLSVATSTAPLSRCIGASTCAPTCGDMWIVEMLATPPSLMRSFQRTWNGVSPGNTGARVLTEGEMSQRLRMQWPPECSCLRSIIFCVSGRTFSSRQCRRFTP